MQKPWLKSYPDGVLENVDINEFSSVANIFDTSIAKFGDLPAYTNFGKTLSYHEVDVYTSQLGAYLKNEQDKGIILIQINVSIIKATEDDGEMYCRADSALFNSESNTLELTGRAEVSFEGSLYQASRILIDLNTNEITMEGGVSGNIHEGS